jgi:hypothetical protein
MGECKPEYMHPDISLPAKVSILLRISKAWTVAISVYPTSDSRSALACRTKTYSEPTVASSHLFVSSCSNP